MRACGTESPTFRTIASEPTWRASCHDDAANAGDDSAGTGRKNTMRPHSAKLALLLIPALALASSSLGAGGRLAIRVSPRIAFAPASLVVAAVAERDPGNRALQIEVDSSEYHRSSMIQLDGDDAARTTTVRYDAVPGGAYDVRATLFGSDGQQRAVAVQHVEILSHMDR
jgi:hypothetical protein